MTIINLTPHQINFYDEDGENLLMSVEASGEVARVKQESILLGGLEVEGNIFKVFTNHFSEVYGLPAPKEDTIYIVSNLVAQRCKDRDDVYIVNGTVRDESGRIIGCTSLAKV